MLGTKRLKARIYNSIKSRSGLFIDIRNTVDESTFLTNCNDRTLADIDDFINLVIRNSISLPLLFHGEINRDGVYPTYKSLSFEDRKVISIGVGNNQILDASLHRKGANIFMFDHITPPSTKFLKKNPRMHYFPIGLGPVKKGNLNSLEGIMETSLIKSEEKLALLKIDIEGDEYKSLKNVSVKTWQKIDQFAIEFHHLNRFTDNAFAKSTINLFHKILQQFSICYVSANNFSGSALLPSKKLWPFTLEFLFVNKEVITDLDQGGFANLLNHRNINWYLGKDLTLTSWINTPNRQTAQKDFSGGWNR
jgi:hypothetical protein